MMKNRTRYRLYIAIIQTGVRPGRKERGVEALAKFKLSPNRRVANHLSPFTAETISYCILISLYSII